LAYFILTAKKKMNRRITNTIRAIMDDGLPAFIRDSRWFMYPFFWYWFKGKNINTYMNFKKIAWQLTDKEFNKIYRELNCRATDRPSDLTNKCINLMLDNLSTNSSNLLDVGCGRGFWLSILAEKTNYSLTGCDVFESSPIKNITYKQGNIEQLPFEDKSFDIVTCHHTIEHIRSIEKAVAELKRVARKQLIIVTPKQRYFYYTLDLHLHFFPEKEYLIHQFGYKDATCINCAGDWCLVINL